MDIRVQAHLYVAYPRLPKAIFRGLLTFLFKDRYAILIAGLTRRYITVIALLCSMFVRAHSRKKLAPPLP